MGVASIRLGGQRVFVRVTSLLVSLVGGKGGGVEEGGWGWG